MKILVFSHLYPNEMHSYQGCFVKEQLQALSQYHAIQAAVVSGYPLGLQIKSVGKFIRSLKAYFRELNRAQWVVEADGIPVFRFPYLINRQVLPFPVRAFSYLTSVLWCLKLLQKQGPFRLIHSHTGFLDGFSGWVVSQLFKLPLVITEHTGPFSTLTSHGLTRWVTVKAMSSAVKVIAVSESLGLQIQAVLPVSSHAQLMVVPNGVDTEYFHLPEDSAPETKPVQKILSVISLDPNKNPFNLLVAFALLIAQGHNLTLNLVGKRPLAEEIKAWIMDNDLSERVTLWEYLNREDIARMMRDECDIFVLPSQSETFGVVVIEALASGKPVVSTRCGGPQSILTEPFLGELCKVNDSPGLAAAIEKVIQNRSAYASSSIRQHVMTHFTYHVIAETLQQVYQTLV